jgi:hypothetical protein
LDKLGENIHINFKFPDIHYLFPYLEVNYRSNEETYYIRYVDEVRLATLDSVIETLEMIGNMKLFISKLYVYCSHPLYNFSRQQLLKTRILFSRVMPHPPLKIQTREQFEKVKGDVVAAIKQFGGLLDATSSKNPESKPIYNFNDEMLLADINREFELSKGASGMCNDSRTLKNNRIDSQIEILNQYPIEYIYYFSEHFYE